MTASAAGGGAACSQPLVFGVAVAEGAVKFEDPIVAEGLAQRDTQLLNALNRLENKNKEAAGLMRTLLDELTEAYSQLHSSALNPDLVFELSEAAITLNSLRDVITNFTEAIDGADFSKLPRNFEDY